MSKTITRLRHLLGPPSRALALTIDREVVVKADRRLKYKDVRKLMQTINEAGFTRVGLITERKALAGT